jgi:hypothetical protein
MRVVGRKARRGGEACESMVIQSYKMRNKDYVANIGLVAIKKPAIGIHYT